MGAVEVMRQPMILQTNITMIMREQAQRYLASKWPLFTEFVFNTDIVLRERRWRELTVLVDNNYYTFLSIVEWNS